MYKRLLLLSILITSEIACTGSCNPKPTPSPTPTSTPIAETGRPSEPVGLEGLIRVVDGKFTRGGKPFARIGAIPCWPTDGTGDKLFVEGREIPYLWPLVSAEWIEYASSKTLNFGHIRTTPIPASNVCCGLQEIGSFYLADMVTKNPKYIAKIHELGRASVKYNFGIEDDIFDGWVMKHCKSGDFSCVISPEVAYAVPLHPQMKKLVSDIVYETCNYANWTYQISNEASLTPGWTVNWERAMYSEIRIAENQSGCGKVVHVIGSNSIDHDGPYEYLASHNPNEDLKPTNGKPTVVNEYNPHLSPATIASKVCEAKKNSQGFDYWRSDGTDAQQNETINLISKGCDSPIISKCPDPKPDNSKLDFWVDCSVMNSCDFTPFQKGDHNYCVAIGMGEMGGQPRFNCPMRNEGHPDRLACEQFVLGAPHPIYHSDGEVSCVDTDCFRVRTTGSWIEACDVSNQHCKRYTF